MKKAATLYMIGERIKRIKLIILALISVILGVILGVLLNSKLISIIASVILMLLTMIITRKYYWIISQHGIFTPLNFGMFNYLIVMFQYMFIGEDKSDIVFIHYKTINYLNLLSHLKGIEIQVIWENHRLVSIVIDEDVYNQDLINSINYIKRKGIDVKNLNVLENIEIKNKNKLKIYKKKF